MSEPLWQTGCDLPPPTIALPQAFTDPKSVQLFPPLAAINTEGFLEPINTVDVHASLCSSLSEPRFDVFRDLLFELDNWCVERARQHRDVVAPSVFSLTNTGLFAPLTHELFSVAAANRHRDPAGYLRQRVADFQTWLNTFLDRFVKDREQLSVDSELAAVTACGSETHNRGRRVLRLDFADGRQLAYKPRPVQGEYWITSNTEDSLFSYLNSLIAPVGEMNLPVIEVHRGQNGEYLWQEWVAPSAVAQLGSSALTGPVLADDEASWFYKRAGMLAAACHAFGIGDLIEGNVVIGDFGGDTRYVPIDVEIFFRSAPRLSATGLIPSGDDDTHHVGYENQPRTCGDEGTATYLAVSGENVELRLADRCWRRTTAQTVSADQSGHIGYREYLDDFTSGMFDFWALACTHRDEIAEYISERLSRQPVRVLARSTAEYVEALSRYLFRGEKLSADFDASERVQLESGDVPYFICATPGSKLSYFDGTDWISSDIEIPADSHDPTTMDGSRLDLSSLGLPLRDAVEYAYTDGTIDPVKAPTSVEFAWPDAECYLRYEWDDEFTRLVPQSHDFSAENDRLATRLRRIDEIDARLRNDWVASGFTDDSIGEQLKELTDSAVDWLTTVVDVHGWISPNLVGEEAADAAARLVQHLDDRTGVQRRLLDAMSMSVRAGDTPGKHFAYTWDAWCVAMSRPQRYGTKFEHDGHEFVPYRLENRDSVDELREALGLPPLAEYALAVKQRFGSVAPEGK